MGEEGGGGGEQGGIMMFRSAWMSSSNICKNSWTTANANVLVPQPPQKLTISLYPMESSLSLDDC
jgi:hypothetical protein